MSILWNADTSISPTAPVPIQNDIERHILAAQQLLEQLEQDAPADSRTWIQIALLHTLIALVLEQYR